MAATSESTFPTPIETLPETKPAKILVIDVGGTHVKILASGEKQPREVASGPSMTAMRMVEAVKKLATGWGYEAIAMGYPGPVAHGRILREPYNLGAGWMGFNFTRAFGYPLKIVNDAVMQALGSYKGGSMLFLGLGTGLGSAMVVNGIVAPMELAHLPYKKKTYEDYLGVRALKRMGRKKWERHVLKVIESLRTALEVDEVAVGGGNSKKLDADKLPPKTRLVDNSNAFLGGFRLWEAHSSAPPPAGSEPAQ